MLPVQTIPYKNGDIYRRKRRIASLASKTSFELWLCNPALGLVSPEAYLINLSTAISPDVKTHNLAPGSQFRSFASFEGPSSVLPLSVIVTRNAQGRSFG